MTDVQITPIAFATAVINFDRRAPCTPRPLHSKVNSEKSEKTKDTKARKPKVEKSAEGVAPTKTAKPRKPANPEKRDAVKVKAAMPRKPRSAKTEQGGEFNHLRTEIEKIDALQGVDWADIPLDEQPLGSQPLAKEPKPAPKPKSNKTKAKGEQKEPRNAQPKPQPKAKPAKVEPKVEPKVETKAVLSGAEAAVVSFFTEKFGSIVDEIVGSPVVYAPVTYSQKAHGAAKRFKSPIALAISAKEFVIFELGNSVFMFKSGVNSAYINAESTTPRLEETYVKCGKLTTHSTFSRETHLKFVEVRDWSKLIATGCADSLSISTVVKPTEEVVFVDSVAKVGKRSFSYLHPEWSSAKSFITKNLSETVDDSFTVVKGSIVSVHQLTRATSPGAEPTRKHLFQVGITGVELAPLSDDDLTAMKSRLVEIEARSMTQWNMPITV